MNAIIGIEANLAVLAADALDVPDLLIPRPGEKLHSSFDAVVGSDNEAHHLLRSDSLYYWTAWCLPLCKTARYRYLPSFEIGNRQCGDSHRRGHHHFPNHGRRGSVFRHDSRQHGRYNSLVRCDGPPAALTGDRLDATDP